MPKKYVSFSFMFTLALLLLRISPASAAHSNVTLYKWLVVSTCQSGSCVGGSLQGLACETDNQCAGFRIGTDVAAVTAANEPYSPKATCGRCHDYGSGLFSTVHSQGVKESDNQIYWQAYETKSFEHGVSVGRHMNQGRNENYLHDMRATFGDPWFTSAPGMAGKF